MTAKTITAKAYAKINLTLDVLKRLPSGYHEVEFVMQQISLHDLVSIKEITKGIRIKCDTEGIPTDSRNLCWKAVELMQAETGTTKGIEIGIEKRIPAAGGLAGGSTDAGAVLKALNELWKANLGEKRLLELAEKIGMDVCFCVKGGTVFASGRGEKLRAIKSPEEMDIVLSNPGVEVPTPWAYKNLNYEFAGKTMASRKMEKLLEEGAGRESIAKNLHDDFEFSVLKHFPIIEKVKDKMNEEGALNSIMSGSGSTVFGIAENEGQAKKIKNALSREFPKTFLAKTV